MSHFYIGWVVNSLSTEHDKTKSLLANKSV